MLIQNVGNPAQAAPPARPTREAPADIAVVTQPLGLPDSPAVSSKSAAVEPQLSAEQTQRAVDTINQALKQSNKNLEFSIDESTNKQVFKLTDGETGDVIRQYPTEEMLAISRAIDQVQQGLLLKQEA
ncbi:flagellar protein FlaG [Ferrigenium sp. UT5]|uniref:flagellar protein FlaG n=1 Tax=Ferrigenium sp. UT5 TaxID=3242105 RepID=UPI00355449A2